MNPENQKKITLLTGVIGEDVHVTGIRILEHALGAAGFKVISLGIRNSQEEFVNAAVETRPDFVLVSSLAGHARANVDGLKEKMVEAGMGNVKMYIGGILAVDEPDWAEAENTFKALGFDRVYPPTTLPKKVVQDLEADYAAK
ncbi:MAG: methylaspartate mutase subunit S [Chloroflexota bacterium]